MNARPCRGFAWIGQSFAHCDRCGLPYWEHTHDEQIKHQGPFSADWTLVPITPEQAAATKRKWGTDTPTAPRPTEYAGRHRA